MANHPYRNVQSGMMVANLLRTWRRDHYEPILLQCQFLKASPKSIAMKIREGILWLLENIKTPEDLEYWRDIHQKLRVQQAPSTVKLVYHRDLLDVAVNKAGDIRMNLRHDFKAWSTGMRTFGDRWPSAPPPVELTDEDITWFKDRLRELEPQGFLGIVQADTLRFAYMPNVPTPQ